MISLGQTPSATMLFISSVIAVRRSTAQNIYTRRLLVMRGLPLGVFKNSTNSEADNLL